MIYKKRIIAVIAASSAIVMLFVGATVAWKRLAVKIENQFKMGSIDFEIISEDFRANSKEGIANMILSNVVPAQRIDTPLKIKNNGNREEIIRVVFSEEYSKNVSQKVKYLLSEGWVKKNGEYIYRRDKVISPGEEVKVLEAICMPEEWDDNEENMEVRISVNVEAIQDINAAEHDKSCLVPGEDYDRIVEIKNEEKVEQDLFLEISREYPQELLRKTKIKILDEENGTIYEGNADLCTGSKKLCGLNAKETRKFRVIVDTSQEIGNEFQRKSANNLITFTLEGVKENNCEGDLPQTGEGIFGDGIAGITRANIYVGGVIMIVGGLMIGAGIILYRRGINRR